MIPLSIGRNKTAYCGGTAQPCKRDSDCLATCYSDCFPCNTASNCDMLVDFGVLAAKGAPCYSPLNTEDTASD